MKKSKFNLRKVKKSLAAWLTDPFQKQLIYDESIEDLNGYLVTLRPAVGLALERIAYWEGMNAAFLLISNNEQGWGHAQRCYRYLCWSRRSYLAYLDRKHFKSLDINEFALLLAHAIAIRDDSFADYLGRRLTASYIAGDEQFTEWEFMPFEPFMVTLYARWRNVDLSAAKTKMRDLDVYQTLLDRWHELDAFKNALEEACEYHVLHSDDTHVEVGEFHTALYMEFPVELLAIKRIREDEGLPMPEIEHPLMQTMLARLPDRMPAVEDELLDKVIAKLQAELGIRVPL